MRMLVISTNYPPDVGGIAAHVKFLSQTLGSAGHEVHVVNLRRAPGEDTVERDGNVELHRVHGHVKIGPLRFSARGAKLQKYVTRLAGELKADVAHVHSEGYEARSVRRLSAHCAPVGTMHSSGFLKTAQTASGRRGLAKALRHLRALTAPSREICAVVDSLGLDPKCVYVPNGVDTTTYRPGIDGTALARELGIDPSGSVVLCARRLVEKNGVIFFAEAAVELCKNNASVIPVFAGSEDEEYGARVREVLERNGVMGRCLFTGPLPNTRMPELLGLAKVSVLPSLVEATSITCLEAMASQCAVVATDVGGLPELIENGVHGRLVPPRKPAELAAAVSDLLDDEGARTRLAAEARARACEEFDWGVIARRMVDVYEDARSRMAG